MRKALGVCFWVVIVLLAAALVMTIIGSAVNNNTVLNVGIIMWLSCCALFFSWLVLWIWARSKRYPR